MKLEFTDKEKRLLDIIGHSAPLHPEMLADDTVRKIYFVLADMMLPDENFRTYRGGLVSGSRQSLTDCLTAELTVPRGFVNAATELGYILRPVSSRMKDLALSELREPSETVYSRKSRKFRAGRIDYKMKSLADKNMFPQPYDKLTTATIDVGWGFDEFIFYMFSQGFVTIKKLAENVDEKTGKVFKKVFDRIVVPNFIKYVERKRTL